MTTRTPPESGPSAGTLPEGERTLTEDLAAWDDLTARIYADADFSPGGREAALALAWALHRDSDKGGWGTAARILGADRVYRDRARIWVALAEDVPFYDPGNFHYSGAPCEGPRLRAYKARRGGDPDRCIVSDHHPHLGECRYTVIHGDLSSFWGPSATSQCAARTPRSPLPSTTR